MSNLIVHKSILYTIGYADGPHYIGLLNSMWLYCTIGNHQSWHDLMVKSDNEYKYVCRECNCSVIKVGE